MRVADVGEGLHEPDSRTPRLELARVPYSPVHPRRRAGDEEVEVVGPNGERRADVSHELGPREAPLELKEQLLHLKLFEVRQHGFGHEQDWRAIEACDLVHPARVCDRRSQVAIPLRLRQQLPPKRDDIRKVEIDPEDLAVVDPLEPRVQAGSELHDSPTGIAPQEVAYEPVELAQPNHYLHQITAGESDPSPVVVDLGNHHCGQGIRHERLAFALFHSPRPQRDEQRLRHSVGRFQLQLGHVSSNKWIYSAYDDVVTHEGHPRTPGVPEAPPQEPSAVLS